MTSNSIALHNFSRAPKNLAASERVPKFATALFSPNYNEVFRQAHRERVQSEMTPRTLLSKLAEGSSVTVDVLSVTRNSMTAGAILEAEAILEGAGAALEGTDALSKIAPAVGSLAIVGGALGTASGLNIVGNSALKLSTDIQNGNWEGGFDHGVFALIGTSYATLSASMVASNAAVFAGALVPAAAAGLAITGAGFAMYGGLSIWSGYGLAVNHAFRSRLEERLQEGKDAALLPAMIWLGEQVRGGWSQITLQKKWDQFAFRTSEAACRLVREKITSEFLTRLEANDPGALEEAKFIISEVKRANAKQLVKDYLLMAIALLGIAAFACGLIFAASPIAPLLFAIGAILWIGIDATKAHEILGDLICGKSEIPAAKLT